MLFFRLVKFEHTVFALPFAYAGAFLAEVSVPGFWRMVWITVVMVAARSLAMALNRLLDAGIDAQNPRTAVQGDTGGPPLQSPGLGVLPGLSGRAGLTPPSTCPWSPAISGRWWWRLS